MKRFTVLLSLLLFFFFSLTLSYAQTSSGNMITIPKTAVTDGNYFVAGDSITFSGIVNGDAYIAGGAIDMNGIINGDLLIAGGTVTIRGKVTGNVRAVGGQIMILGTVGRDVSAASGEVTIADSARIGRSANLAGGSIVHNGTIVQDLNVTGKDVGVNGSIGGDTHAFVQNLDLQTGARIKGNVIYWSQNTARIQKDVKISGHTTHHVVVMHESENKQKMVGIAHWIGLFITFVSFISSLLLGLLLLRFFPVFTEHVTSIASKRPWMSFLVGFLAMIVLPILILLLIMSLIGLPFAFLLFAVFFTLVLLAKLFVVYVIGKWAFASVEAKKGSVYGMFILGLLIYTIISFIPVIGHIFSFIVFLIGLGAIIMSKKDFYQMLHDKKLI